MTGPDAIDAIAEIAHWRSLYRAAFGLACDACVENAKLQRQVTELHEERRRYAVQLFGRTPADAPGEES